VLLKIKSFSVLDKFKLEILFSNSEKYIVDLQDELDGEVFEPLKNESLFKQAYLTPWHVIEWPNGADFAPEFLYEKARGQKLS
jgi:hypothetical protein